MLGKENINLFWSGIFEKNNHLKTIQVGMCLILMKNAGQVQFAPRVPLDIFKMTGRETKLDLSQT